MDERFQMLYTEALAAGKEKIYNIRVMIVGHQGVGKTSLTQRLLGEQVKENQTESTEGIDVHTRCCQIDHATKKWTRTVTTDYLSINDQRIVSIMNNYVPQTNTNVTEEMMSDPVNVIFPVIESEPSSRDPITVLPGTLDEDMQNQGEFSQCEESGITAEESCDVPISHVADVNKEIKRKTCAEEIQTFYKRAKSLTVSKSVLSDVTLLDFAGQSIFSTTHQAFMSWRTLYLLVTNMSLPLTDAVEEGACINGVSGKETCSIQEHVKFWLNSVHSHVCVPQDELINREEKNKNWGECGAPVLGSNGNRPCVILVGTHSDKIPKESLDKRKKEYFNAIRNVLNSHLLLHITDEEFAISNLGSDPNIDALKSKIFDVAQNQVYWGQEIPARWIPLTKALMEKRNSGIQVMDYDEVNSLNETLPVRIEKPEELDLFLRFEHDMGNIVFFNNEKLKKKVLLDPEWLIHGVKIWITSDQVIKRHPELSEQWHAFRKTGRLTSALIENLWASHSEIIQNKEYLLDVMEKLNIIAKPLHKEEEYYWVPCMVSEPAPDNVKKLQQNKDTTQTSTLCFRSKTKFIHVGVFQRLLATCLSKWTPTNEGNLLFRDLCVFDLDEQQQLVLSLNDFVIQATVIRFTHQGRTPDLQLCMTIRNDLYSALSEISDSLCPGSELEICIKCKESSALTNEGLHSISTLRTKDELRCSTHNEFHCVESRELLRFWEEDNHREIPVNVLPEHLARETERFTRFSSLVIDIGTKVLRKILIHYTNTSLDEYMKNNERDILKLRPKKILTQAQVDIILPQIGQTDPEQYDITIASALLSNIYPLLGQQEKQLIADLRTQRNDLAHYTSTRMSEHDFKTKWTRVTSILTDLSIFCNDLDFKNDIQKEIKDIQQTGLFAVLSHLPEITKELKRVCRFIEEITTI
ncbi:hypothetical protein ACJMK2_012348 [Sinanodonta woodiana]|uniref:Uncharacterized protein n=1 Tax=Sinanodonta woodiana TaxID=1069815 RepID=A0ABD3V7X2_SINWO